MALMKSFRLASGFIVFLLLVSFACKNMAPTEKTELFDYFSHFSPIKLKYKMEFSQDEFHSSRSPAGNCPAEQNRAHPFSGLPVPRQSCECCFLKRSDYPYAVSMQGQCRFMIWNFY